ncbi:metallophosphoesterase [Prauserella marina]|uniref:Predicted phosphoesterase n=1 Tax=Prauserella marina TaxID=530584 RepID=A0A222VKB1_9PSEU|nr:metallophosphoesterase [Prauserella marina]ASR34324.1 metallophosphoesterase [Prauserella marina]PWV71892.1 Icc-related predicted phosphoesterase [Prauserella marina]SDD90172.1 Predicted phosphoesterase [Prauserella marina]
MPRALVVADEVEERLWTGCGPLPSVDLVLAAGDLPFDYLDHLAGSLDCPLVFVPGNHDPDLSGFTRFRGLTLRAGFPVTWPGPLGGGNADARVVDVAGIRVAGLGGSPRYRPGPNQWTQRQQARRARTLVRKALWKGLRAGSLSPRVDVLLCHAPPRGVGDRPDPAHQGFDCLHRTVRRLRPRWLLHGHIHPHGERVAEHRMGPTRVRNVVGAHIVELGPRDQEPTR